MLPCPLGLTQRWAHRARGQMLFACEGCCSSASHDPRGGSGVRKCKESFEVLWQVSGLGCPLGSLLG